MVTLLAMKRWSKKKELISIDGSGSNAAPISTIYGISPVVQTVSLTKI
jgi:hypothetical protein